MALVIESLEAKYPGIMILTPEESELFLELSTKTSDIVHDGGLLYYYTPAEVMVMVDRRIYNEYEARNQ